MNPSEMRYFIIHASYPRNKKDNTPIDTITTTMPALTSEAALKYSRGRFPDALKVKVYSECTYKGRLIDG